ncbi:hypothetical protein ACH5RR_010304 [Cinchona calisaya]|uniref:Uncharacterized protein n=1 Tax=Cinchona calisaya TaxID=153742 RepID=A0ABD3AGS9_9GENT
MLQWMGGARRKVTSTRKSTQKRQKQYFEQRRRQQQVIDEGKDSMGKSIYGEHRENCRSLDILSLLNLSTVVKENKSNCPLAGNEPEHDALNCQTVQRPQAFQSFQTSEITPPGPPEVEEARSSSSCQAWNPYSKMTPVNTIGNHARALNSCNDKKNQLKMVPEYQELRMIDILDDEPNLSFDKSLEREAHAAFSIEGLGKVEMETPIHTPVHSPEVNGRTFFHGCSSPPEAMKPAYSFIFNSELVNHEVELDAMMQGVEVSLSKNSVEHSFCSKDRLDLFSKPKQKPLDKTKGSSLLDDYDNDFIDLLGDDELFYQNRERNRHTLDATSSSLPGKSLDESAFGLSFNNWMDQTDDFADYYGMDCMKKEFTFQGSYHQKRRTTMRKSGKFGPIGSPAPYLKNQKSENFQNFTIPEMTRNPPVQRDIDVRDVADQPRWSSFTFEDTRDDLSLPSEESSSSSAVRGVSKNGPLNSKEKQTSKSFDFGCSQNICSENNTFGREENFNKWKTPWQGENINGPRMFMKISDPSISKTAHNSNSTPEKRLKPENSRLFETACDPGKIVPGHSSYCQTPETTKHSSSRSKLWIEDPFGTSGDPNSYDSGSFFEGFSKSSADCSPSCNLASEKIDFHQPKLENNMSGSSMLNLSEDCNMVYGTQKILHADSCLVSERLSFTKEGNENSDILATVDGKIKPQRDFSHCRKTLSFENGKYLDQVGSEDKCSDCKESTTGTSEVGDSVTEKHSFQHAEETSPSVETSAMFDGNRCHVVTKCQHGDQASEANLAIEGFGSEKRRMGIDKQSGLDSTCQVMMLNSCVLQLFCIQVLKEASGKVTGKKTCILPHQNL